MVHDISMPSPPSEHFLRKNDVRVNSAKTALKPRALSALDTKIGRASETIYTEIALADSTHLFSLQARLGQRLTLPRDIFVRTSTLASLTWLIDSVLFGQDGCSRALVLDPAHVTVNHICMLNNPKTASTEARTAVALQNV